MNELSLFSGSGGGLLASHLLGWNPIGYVEWDDYSQRVIAQRIKDRLLPRAPIFGDVREFVESGAAREYRGFTDVVSGGFPCQDISCAGRGGGLTGDRSSLWYAMLRTVEIVRPEFVFAENAKELRTRGLQEVIEGLAGLGYCVRWGVLGAGHVGAPHIRKRMWIVANANGSGKRVQPLDGKVAWTPADVEGSEITDSEVKPVQSLRGQQGAEPGNKGGRFGDAAGSNSPAVWDEQRRLFGEEGEGEAITRVSDWWDLPRFEGVDDGDAHRMDRTRATGNAQVPSVAALAWRLLTA